MREPKSSTSTRLSGVMGILHDSVNRFLLRESYGPKDLFNEAKQLVNLIGGTVNVSNSQFEFTQNQARDDAHAAKRGA